MLEDAAPALAVSDAPRPWPDTPLRISPVTTARDLDVFIDLPRRLYGSGHPHWAQPLQLERRRFLGGSTNRFFRHARARFWIAWRGERPVGRISAQIDERVQRRVDPGLGQWGMFDAEPDPEIAAALFGAAEDWLRHGGMLSAIGPCNLALNDEPGLLVDGFDRPTIFLTSYSPPYLHSLIERAGYAKAQDRLAYVLDLTRAFPQRIQRFLDYRAEAPFRIRSVDLRQFAEEARRLERAFDTIFGDNWGYLPIEFEELIRQRRWIRLLCRSRWIKIAEVNGEIAGITVTLPNTNELVSDLGGRLLPLNWLRLAYRAARPRTDWVRVPVFGLHPDFRKSRIGVSILYSLSELARRDAAADGATQADLCWIQEHNEPMIKLIEAMGARHHKTFRLFRKTLMRSDGTTRPC